VSSPVGAHAAILCLSWLVPGRASLTLMLAQQEETLWERAKETVGLGSNAKVRVRCRAPLQGDVSFWQCCVSADPPRNCCKAMKVAFIAQGPMLTVCVDY